MPSPKLPKESPLRAFSKSIFAALFVFILISALYSGISSDSKSAEKISFSNLAQEIKADKVASIEVIDNELQIKFKDGTEKISQKENGASLSESLAGYGVKPEEISKISVEVKSPSGIWFWAINILPFLLPLIAVVLFFWFTTRQMKSANMQAFTFGMSRARISDGEKNKITFRDVAGAKEAKEELQEIVEFLKNPKKFLDIGARIPKGVLLMGAPGTGKTLMARAVAGEANVPFFHISGSEFVEMFVGVGASRVRDLFRTAKRSAPSIIFVDEIDAVGRHRGAGLGGGHDEREQTLNQILVEMDGFEPHEKVIVMAATNRPDVLDPALLRPGRFDRRVVLDLPDLGDREEILGIHAKGKPLGEDVKLRVIAERTPGFSGADLQNLMNEAAILTARENRKKVAQIDLIRSIEKVMLGSERKSHLLTKDEKKIAAYHEAGHALLASVLPNADPVHKVSVVSRGRAAGYTLKLPIEERHLFTRAHFIDEIAVSLGGYAAEKMIFGDITTGASDDISHATDTAHALVTKYGMSEKIGPVAWGERGEAIFLGKDFMTEKNYSEDVARQIDEEVSKIMKDANKEARGLLGKNKQLLKEIAGILIEKETIERDEFDALLKKFGIKSKKLDPHLA